MDTGLMGSSCDPYVNFSFEGINYKTEIFKYTKDPIFGVII